MKPEWTLFDLTGTTGLNLQEGETDYDLAFGRSSGIDGLKVGRGVELAEMEFGNKTYELWSPAGQYPWIHNPGVDFDCCATAGLNWRVDGRRGVTVYVCAFLTSIGIEGLS